MAGQRCLTHGLWDALGDQIAAFLASVTLQEVLDGIPPGKQTVRVPATPCGVARGMSAERTYLDWNATAPLRPEARAACVAALDVVGNPSSPHAEGRRARAIVEDAREQVAALVGAKPAEVVFTSGGTEANNAVLAGGLGYDLSCPASSTTRCWRPRAPARRASSSCRSARNGVVRVGCADRVATRQPPAARSCRCRWPTTRRASAAGGRGGRGGQGARLVRAHRCRAGRRPHPRRLARARRRLPDAVGPQDRRAQGHRRAGDPRARKPAGLHCRRRPGAPPPRGNRERARPSPGSVRRPRRHSAISHACSSVAALRDRLEGQVRAVTPAAVVIGADAERLPNTTSIALAGASAETLVIALDLAGDRGERGRGVLVGQGGHEPRAGGHGFGARPWRARPSA